MSERKSKLRAHLERLHVKTWPILQGLAEDDLKVTVYSEGEQTWTVKDILGHLADSERGNLGQAQRLVAGERTVPEDFDLDRWNRSAVRKSQVIEPADLLEQISTAYHQSLEFIEGVDEQQLDLEGLHSSLETLTTEGFIRRMIDHRAAHVADIEAALTR